MVKWRANLVVHVGVGGGGGGGRLLQSEQVVRVLLAGHVDAQVARLGRLVAAEVAAPRRLRQLVAAGRRRHRPARTCSPPAHLYHLQWRRQRGGGEASPYGCTKR